MAISAPRRARISSLSSVTRSLPSKTMRPDAISPGCSIRRMMLSAVTLFPHPDSPTRPMIWPGWIAKETPSTARASPLRVRKCVVRPSMLRRAEPPPCPPPEGEGNIGPPEGEGNLGVGEGNLGVADTRIQEGIGDVHHHVCGHDQERAEEHRAHYERNVQGKDGVDRLLADTGPGENGFDHDHAGEEVAKVHPELADDDGQGVGDGVLLDHLALCQSLGPGGADVVALEDVEQAGAQQARGVCGASEAERQRRKQEILGSPGAIPA